MRNLITGGAGFIGSHLAERLVEKGEEIIVLDDFSTGRREHIESLLERPGTRLVRGSVTDDYLVSAVMQECDRVYHLAAAVGVFLVVRQPVDTIIRCAFGTEIVLKHAAARNVPTLIASTSEVYGRREEVPFSEDDDLRLGPPVQARWSYACSKALDEFLALAYHKERGLPVVIARLFNTVGPRQVGFYGMVLPRFVGQALKGGPITVYGTGKQRRCFAHVKDVVGALERLATEPRAIGGVFNIGSDQEISILELAEHVKRIVNPKAEIQLIPYREAYEEGFEDPLRRMPDLSKIRRLIGYQSTVGIDEIIRQVAAYEKACLSEAKP